MAHALVDAAPAGTPAMPSATPAVKPGGTLTVTPAGLPPALRRVGNRVPVLAVALVLAWQLLSPHGWAGLSVVPLTVAVVLGLPHGAVDHLVPTWFSARRATTRTVLGIGTAYGAAAAAVLGVFVLASTVATLLFLALSVWHFGAGEVVYAESARADHERRSAAWTAVRTGILGAVPVLVPLVRWPDQVRPVLHALMPRADALLTPGLRQPVLAVLVGAALAVALTELLHGARRPAGELLLLLALVLIVPPLAAFAVYFGAWHSLRHVLRLVAADPENAPMLARGRTWPPLRRFALLAAVPSVLSLAVLAALWLSSDGPVAFVATDLRVLAALTVPHMVIVAWLDRVRAA